MNKPIQLFIFFLVSITIIISCNKNKYFQDPVKNCINNFNFPFEDSIDTKSYFNGSIGDQSVRIFSGSGNYFFKAKSVLYFTSLPGEEINPFSDSLKNKKIGLTLVFSQKDFNTFPISFGINTPPYSEKISFVDIIDSLLIHKDLLIGDDNIKLRGYTFYFTIPCNTYNLSPVIFASGYKWGQNYYYDQVNKWIKIIDFKKGKNIFGKFVYDIIFDINVNIYSRNGYFGEVKGIFKTHFTLKQ